MENTEQRIAELEREVAELKALLNKEVVRLDERVNKTEEGVCYFIEQHGNEHVELYRKVSASFSRTHPEIVATLHQCDEILGLNKPKN